jgi:ethanolamine transporter EutH
LKQIVKKKWPYFELFITNALPSLIEIFVCCLVAMLIVEINHKKVSGHGKSFDYPILNMYRAEFALVRIFVQVSSAWPWPDLQQMAE